MTSFKVQVLDCTIRDGNYAVDSQFTAEDTAILAAGLSTVGIRHIEVGHGLGLGGDRHSASTAATSDIESIMAARQAIKGQSLVGCFYIPSIGSFDEMRAAVDAGLQFIRLGADIDRYADLQSCIELARSLDLEVWCNLMKSYVEPPDFFAKAVRDLADMGAHTVALVDSAGGMAPDQVAQYTQAALSLTDIPLGFHGHDNLRLAVANCLRFVECGGQFVDGSLGGIGRSSGNAATELLVALLARKALLPPEIDWKSLLEFADEFLRFSVPHRPPTECSEAVMGLGYVHSGFESIIHTAAVEHDTTLARTVLSLPENASKSVSADMAQQAAMAAAELKSLYRPVPSVTGVSRHAVVDRSEPKSLDELESILSVEKGKWMRKAVVSIVLDEKCNKICLRPLRSTSQILVAHIEVSELHRLAQVYDSLDHCVDAWLFDQSIDPGYWIQSSHACYGYHDEILIEQACLDTLQTINVRSVKWLGGVNDNRLTERLPLVHQNDETEKVDAIIVTSALSTSSSLDLEKINDGGYLVLAAAGLVPEDSVETARLIGINVIRVDYGPALLAEAERLVRTCERTAISTGEVSLPNGIKVVAGGQVGPAGAFIVDSIDAPRFILGKADGTGGVQPLDVAANDQLPGVQTWIYGHWVQSVTNSP